MIYHVNVNMAMQTYADRIGKTVNELTDVDRRQAIVNATIAEIKDQDNKLNPEMPKP